MNLNREIFSVLERIARDLKVVKLINAHKGIPVSYEATIQGFNELGVIFRVHKFQTVCLELERQTYLYIEELPSVIKARVAQTDVVENLATLTGFAYAVDTIGKRMMVRVEPELPITVVISNSKRRLKADLVDISEVGIGLFTHPAHLFTPSLFTRDSQVRINLRLPTEPANVVIDGMINHIEKSDDAYHLGIIISPDEHAKEAIASFISKRQVEILGELQMLYDQMYQLKVGE